MKKVLYFILVAVELFVGSLLMSSLILGGLLIPALVAIAATAGLAIWQIVAFKKADDPAAKRSKLRNIALILLIPGVTFVVAYIAIAILFILSF